MSVCRDNLLNCALRNGGREFDSLTFRQYFIGMEIRRCDRCNADIDPKLLEKIDYYHGEDDGKAMGVTIPIARSIAEQKELYQDGQSGLDDRDEFGNLITHQTIDLCYDCGVGLAGVIKVWLTK